MKPFNGPTSPSSNSAPEAQGTGETALVAGYYASGDSARPGFGWFFGRDSLYTLYAVNGYGDFALSKAELEFLIHRQRADGKIMHEYSQTAAAIDWQAFPYMYAAADSTPLFLLAVEDYVKASGDTAFLTPIAMPSRRPGPSRPIPRTTPTTTASTTTRRGQDGWKLARRHAAPGDLSGPARSAGVGAMARSKSCWAIQTKSPSAQQRADAIAKTIESEYYDPEKSCYAFSRNADGSQDRTSTVYPAHGVVERNWPAPSLCSHPEGCLEQLPHTRSTPTGACATSPTTRRSTTA
jgi:glycogen debranching enzyme